MKIMVAVKQVDRERTLILLSHAQCQGLDPALKQEHGVRVH